MLKILETAPQGSRRLQSSFSKEWHPEKMVNLQKRCFEIFEYLMIFAHHCLRPPQKLGLFLEAGEGPGKPGSALEGKVLQIKAGGRLGTAEYRLYIEFCVSVGDKVHYRRLKISLRHLANYT